MWTARSGCRMPGPTPILRLDVRSGKFEVFEPYKIPRPNVYDVIPDSRNNGYVLPLGSEEIVEGSTRQTGR